MVYRESVAIHVHSDDPIVVLPQRYVHASCEVEERLAVVVARRFGRVKEDPAPGGTTRGVLIECRELELPRGFDDLSMVCATEWTPVRPPDIEDVRDQYRRNEQGEQSEQDKPVPALRRPAYFSVPARHAL